MRLICVRPRQVLAASIYCHLLQRTRMAPASLLDRKPLMSKRNNRQESQRPNVTESRNAGREDGSTVSESGEPTAILTESKTLQVATELIKATTQPKPRVTTFVPRDCTACQRLRELDSATEGNSYSRVYSTQGRTRYCKCGYCGHTWKEVVNT